MARNGSQFDFLAAEKTAAGVDVLIVPLAAKPQPPMELVSRVDAVCDDAVSELLSVGAVGDEAGELAFTTRSGAYRRILVVGLGDGAKLEGHHVRSAGAAAARWLMDKKVRQATLWLDGLVATGVANAVGEWAGGMVLGGFRFSEFKSKEGKAPDNIRIFVSGAETGHIARTRPQIREAVALAEATNFARRVAHLPPNVLNPKSLATEARRLADSCDLRCTIMEGAALRRAGMNGLLSVGEGALHGPCLIQLEYHAAPRSRARTVLVGKAVTFDTGGYSIKPADGMEAMKFDKCGGMTVLGVLKAVSDLKLKCNVIGVIAVAENAVSERAYRPADIIRMMSGKTVEIISTDAEGRMVLADALWHAQQKLKPTALIDLATLTGGVRVALGTACAGLMSNDDNLAGELEECGRLTHERLWRLPLWDDYRDLIRGTDSDIKNSAGKRDAHAIVGGMFLKEFIRDGVSWAHLDIAAVATRDDNKAPSGRGATGFGVRLLTEYIRRNCG